MELKAFKVGDTVVLMEEGNGISKGTVVTISHGGGGRPPIDMTLRGDWSYTVNMTDGRSYSVPHRILAFASREARLRSLRGHIEELEKTKKKATFELEKTEKYKDDADFLAHQISAIADKAIQKIEKGRCLSNDTIENIRKEILKMYPSRYKFED